MWADPLGIGAGHTRGAINDECRVPPAARRYPLDVLEEDVGSDHTFLRLGASSGAVGSMHAVWKDQRETEPSVTES